MNIESMDRSRPYFVPRTSYLLKVFRLKKAVHLVCALFLCIFLHACDETGEALDSPAIGSLNFRAYIVDPLSFNVYVNGKLIGAKKQFKYYAGSIRLRIEEVVSGRVIFDDSYAVHASGGTSVLVTVHQSRSGSVPVCLLPPADEQAPPVDYGKIAIIYNLPDFPDSLKAVIENTTTATSNVYVPTDSLIVMKNELSGFFLGRYGQKKARVRFYTAGDERRPVAVTEGSQVANMSKGFSIYLATGKSAGAIPLLTIDKIY